MKWDKGAGDQDYYFMNALRQDPDWKEPTFGGGVFDYTGVINADDYALLGAGTGREITPWWATEKA